jgi:ribonucleoside-triphosphate reductase
MRLETTFSEEFDVVYNKFNQSEQGKQILEIEGIARKNLDVGEMSHSYFTNRVSDISIDPNSNANGAISPNNYGAEIVKGIQKIEGYYLLHRYAVKRLGLERANYLIRSLLYGNIYFHDASGVGIQQPYCMSSSTQMLMLEGRPYGQLHSLPPKRADSFMAQCIEFGIDLSQSWCGAIALADIFINYAWYAKKESLDDKRIQNDIQKAVHIYNNSFRVGGQSPFINISIFDMPNLKRVFEHHIYPDGSSPDFDYIMHIQKIFCEWFAKGDPSSGFPYRFPIVTINLYCDENKNIIDKSFLDFTASVNCSSGCFNIYVNSGEKIASCCRLINDRARMPARFDSFANGGLNLGSHRVVTINLPRVAIKANKDINKFYCGLAKQLETCKDLLLIHREEILERRIKRGFLQFYNPLKWFTLDRMFSTIGITGVYEMCYFMGMDIKNEDGCKFVFDVLKFIEDYSKKTSEKTKHSFNVEEIPSESTAVKFVQKDKVLFGKESIPFELYSNQYLPLIADATLPERIEISGRFQDILSGGGILHLNVAEKITDPSTMKQLIEYSVQKGVSHLAVNYGFGECEDGHVTVCGNSQICPICKKKIISWTTRIVGYFTKVDSWSKTRREYEFPKRVFK